MCMPATALWPLCDRAKEKRAYPLRYARPFTDLSVAMFILESSKSAFDILDLRG
jgi:hypothetical protein